MGTRTSNLLLLPSNGSSVLFYRKAIHIPYARTLSQARATVAVILYFAKEAVPPGIDLYISRPTSL